MKLILYLLGINLTGLFLVWYIQKQKINFNALFIFIGLLGGALGILLGKVFFHYRSNKENMLMQVILPCILAWQILGCIVYYHGFQSEISWNIFPFILDNIWFMYYLLAINLITCMLFGLDKWKAKKDHTRISITTLLLGCAMGGAIGGILGMMLFRHKIRKNYFYLGVPSILITQIMILLCIVNW